MGYCVCCDSEVTFKSENEWLRDYLCPNCSCKPRERMLMYAIQLFYPNWKDCKIHASSSINRGASVKLKKMNAQIILHLSIGRIKN